MLYSSSRLIDCQRGFAVAERSHRVMRIGCGSHNCRNCGPRLRAEFCARAMRMRQSHRTRKFITFTALPAPPCYACKYVGGCCLRCTRDFNRRVRTVFRWARRLQSRAAARRNRPAPLSPQFAWTNEQGESTGHLHKHALMDLDYIPQALLSAACVRAGLGRVVDIRPVKDMRGGVGYLAKYMAKAKGQRWGRGARRMQSSRGLTAPRAAAREGWRVHSITGHWWSASQDSPFDRKMMPRILADGDPRVLWVGSPSGATAERSGGYKRAPLSKPRGGGAPDSERSKRSDAVVPDGCDGAAAGGVRRLLPPSALHSFDLEKKCVTTPESAQELAA